MVGGGGDFFVNSAFRDKFKNTYIIFFFSFALFGGCLIVEVYLV